MNKFLEIFNVITVVVLAIVIVGAVKVLDNSLSWDQYQDAMKWLVGLTAIGRGLAAQGRVAVDARNG